MRKTDSYEKKQQDGGKLSCCFLMGNFRNFYQSSSCTWYYNKGNGGGKIDYHKPVLQVIAYIEENLKHEISNTDLARIAGYSEYHFLRIFKELVHLTPADYIRKRRISEIVKRMEAEKQPIASLAFEYGFNSKENFIRAFKAEHHILPTDYVSAKNSLKLYDRMTFEKKSFQLEVRLEILEPFQLVVYKSDENYIPHFWNKYNTKQWSKKLSGGAAVEDFGVSSWNSDQNRLDYYIGIRETEAHGDLTGTEILKINGGLYAVFNTPVSDHSDFVNTIHSTWDYIGRVWLLENGYQRTGGFELESYAEESQVFSERIYIPLRQKGKEIHEKITSKF